MKQSLFLPAVFLAAAGGAFAINCGTLAVPGSCVLNVNNQVQYTFSNFSLVQTSSNFAPTINSEDIGLTLVTGGGLSAILQVNKIVTTNNPNVVFLANSGGSAGFTFSYDVSIAPLAAGTVLFIEPASISMDLASASGNGSAVVQFIRSGATPGCLVTVSLTSKDCDLPPGVNTSFVAGNILSLTGNTGNASIGQFSDIFNASFTADTTGVPEPSTFALIGAGLAVLYRLRRR